MSEETLQVAVTQGALLTELIGLNRDFPFGQNGGQAHAGHHEGGEHNAVIAYDSSCAPRPVASLSEADLRAYTEMIEQVHAFELLAVYSFLDAADGAARSRVLNSIKGRMSITVPNTWGSLPTKYLSTYFRLSDAVRSFGLVVLYRVLNPGTVRDLLAGAVVDNLTIFYEWIKGFVGEGAECSPVCQRTGICGNCRSGDGP